MQDFEKLGAFYLGKVWDGARAVMTDDLVLYDARNLTTHAVCVGMTGSGKTGLCLGLLEEAAIDGIPALVIDPKGDLANLMLTFPNLAPGDFQTWVDPEEARRNNIPVEELAVREAARWKQGLAEWGQDGARIQKMRDAAEFVVYTPGARAGVPVSILKSFAAPPAAVRGDADALRERAATTATSLLGLLGVDADPLKSREHILLTTILLAAWEHGQDLDLGGLVQAIQTPAVGRVGVMDLESFYPAKERFGLAMTLNNVLAAPGFQAWLEGEALEVGSLLYGPTGKPRIAIFSIAHLADAERMFFVSLLLNQTLAWIRSQPGTSSLRAILYMDEIFGYFPPAANPPSKAPLLTLMKQGRAFGLGVVLATQNPVDLDYKGMANAGTWFVGKLQTERDRARLLDGLEGAGGGLDRKQVETLLDGLGKRVFLLHDVHEAAPRTFTTRWTMSYLRGPLTREEIKKLYPAGAPRSAPAASAPGAFSAPAAPGAAAGPAGPPAASGGSTAGSAPTAASAPVLPPDIPQVTLPVRSAAPAGATLVYKPMLLGTASVRYVDSKTGLDFTQEIGLLGALPASPGAAAWLESTRIDTSAVTAAAESGAAWDALPAEATQAKSYARWKREFTDSVYREQALDLRACARLKAVSQPGESERDFRIRLRDLAREQRDGASEALRAKYAPKLARLQDAVRRAEQARAREAEQLQQQKMQSAVNIGATLLGAFIGGGRRSTLGRASTAARGLGRSQKEAADVERAGDNLEVAQQRLQELDAEFQVELAAIAGSFDADKEPLEARPVRAKKADIAVRAVALAWAPEWRDATGAGTAAWQA